ncbi:hypothetical protein GOBAR_DD01184 [Gossypium barbadense]|nr:hypothetical protein GOBAR_DD01184 [Gossypium barbadense]
MMKQELQVCKLRRGAMAGMGRDKYKVIPTPTPPLTVGLIFVPIPTPPLAKLVPIPLNWVRSGAGSRETRPTDAPT